MLYPLLPGAPCPANHLPVSPQLSATHRARTRAPAAGPRSVRAARASRAPDVKKSSPSRSTTRPASPSSPPPAPCGGGPARPRGTHPREGLRRPSRGTHPPGKSAPGFPVCPQCTVRVPGHTQEWDVVPQGRSCLSLSFEQPWGQQGGPRSGVKTLSEEDVSRAPCAGGTWGKAHRPEVCC